MKLSIRFTVSLIGAALLLAGCGGSAAKLDTTALSAAFQSTSGDRKTGIEEAVAAIGSGDFATAADALKKGVKGGQLTPEQKKAVGDIVAEMQKIASQDADKYPLEVYYAIGEVITVMEGLPVIPRGTTRPPGQ